MAIDQAEMKKYEEELKGLVQRQQEELKQKTNPLFAKMHDMSPEEMKELKEELLKVYEVQKRELASKYGVQV